MLALNHLLSVDWLLCILNIWQRTTFEYKMEELQRQLFVHHLSDSCVADGGYTTTLVYLFRPYFTVQKCEIWNEHWTMLAARKVRCHINPCYVTGIVADVAKTSIRSCITAPAGYAQCQYHSWVRPTITLCSAWKFPFFIQILQVAPIQPPILLHFSDGYVFESHFHSKLNATIPHIHIIIISYMGSEQNSLQTC